MTTFCPTACPVSTTAAPRFAIVLGSGGVRSVAALGMVQVLLRHGLQPDLVVGCSAGALFGALIAAGHNAGEAVRMATTLWSPELTRQRRWRAWPQLLWPRLGRFSADFALRDDARILQRLQQAFGDQRIEDLTIPLRIAATCASTGERVVLRSGSLVQALRASIAMPFLFAPVLIDGRRLIDGVVADPLPVSAASDAGAVLALGFAAQMPQRIDRPARLLAQLSSALTNNLMQARLAEALAGGARLMNITLQLEQRIGLFDTAAMPALVDAGRSATERALPAIRALLQPGPAASGVSHKKPAGHGAQRVAGGV